MSDNLLPVPPNCENFVACSMVLKRPAFIIGDNYEIPLDGSMEKKWRSIIAARARCAWLDMPMPSEIEWMEDAVVVPVFKLWLRSRNVEVSLCRYSWEAFCEHLAFQCQQWGLRS